MVPPRPLRSLVGALVLVLVPLAATAQSTTWVGTTGDWSTGSNWSDGEPTVSVDALVPNASTPTVTLAGEVCRNLIVTIGVAGGGVVVSGGSLAVTEDIRLQSSASGTMSQSAGAVTAARLVIGDTGVGAYSMLHGTLDVGAILLGDGGVGTSGSFVMANMNPVCTVADSLRVGAGGSVNCGAGALTVGGGEAGGIRVDGGVFTLINDPTITTSSFTLTDEATFSVAIGPTGVTQIIVTGTATLAGTLLVTDFGAPSGDHLVLGANPVQGGFAFAFLPTDWSWRVENDLLILTKGVVPTEPTTWGDVKRRFRE